nr:MAG TPA: hypothetical protein [Caudoviricetes sp.]
MTSIYKSKNIIQKHIYTPLTKIYMNCKKSVITVTSGIIPQKG